MWKILSVTLAAGMFAACGQLVTPAQAGCADDAMMTKEMAMEVADADKREMALEHIAMAEEKAKANMESECMDEVMKAKAIVEGKEMMEDKKTN